MKYDFTKQLVMSAGVAATDDVKTILINSIPGALDVRKATGTEDRCGTDWWIDHARGSDISVDTKIRQIDPIQKYGKDDLALETWSIVPGSHSRDPKLQAVGWTLDETKRTDYVLWLWTTTKRWALIPFPQLCAIFRKRLDTWYEIYRHHEQTTSKGSETYRSEMLLVPRREVWAAIYADFGGSIDQTASNDNTPTFSGAANDNRRVITEGARVCADCKQSTPVMLEMTPGKLSETWWLCSPCWRSSTRAPDGKPRQPSAATIAMTAWLAKRGIA